MNALPEPAGSPGAVLLDELIARAGMRPPAGSAGGAADAAPAGAPPVGPEADDARRGWREMFRPDGRPQPAWQRFFDWLPYDAAAAADQLDRAARQVSQQILADGITHNVFSDHGGPGASRPWSLELLPLLIEPDDWQAIERGVAQRARLLSRMMHDLYGPQRLLREALLPPALLHRHPGWLHALHGSTPPGGLYLHIVAFDLARGPDGAWWVIGQRTQNPSGLGYVLHNRMIVSRLFPEAFREMRVQHIASAYRRLLDTVEAHAAEAAGGQTPRVVLLTAGPYSETYFEHAYLARYMGLPLVEGADLTVRDDRLYLKTVEGLEPVHGVLRRLDDAWCDPLELRPDSALGVPGLLQAVRAGRVVMANALGSGFLESPALQGFLPAIAERLLGEPLVMPSLPTWWCGERSAWDAVRHDLDDKLVRASYPRPRGAPGPTIERIEADPDAWTVQGRVPLAHAPLWTAGALASRPATLRVYAIADGRGRWHVLPGGMTRVAAPSEQKVSMQRGGSSLDTWVLTDGQVDLFTMLPQRLRVEDIVARRRPVASRTAENLFWLGRYTERTEQLVRQARATLILVDSDADAPPAVLDAVTALARQSGLAPWEVPSLARAPTVFERSVLAAMADRERAVSIGFNLGALARAAGGLRDRLSTEHWGLVQAMDTEFRAALPVVRQVPAKAAAGAGDAAPHASGDPAAAAELPGIAQALPALDRLAVQLAAVTGAQSDRMTRDHGWRLLTVGRLVERLIGMSRQLVVLLEDGAIHDEAGVELLLDLFDSTITFRARYQRHHDLLALIDTLVLDEANPRSLACVLRRLRSEIGKLPGSAESIDALLSQLPAQGAGLSLDDLRSGGDAVLAERLLALAEHLGAAAARLADEVGSRWFAHADSMLLQQV